MPNILKSPAKTRAAKNFLQSFYDAGGTDRIYIGLGPAAGEWSTPEEPDIPLDTYTEENDFWTNMSSSGLGIGEISQAQETDLVTIRKDWVTSTNYYAYDPDVDTGDGSFDSGTGRNFYVANSDVNPKVYRCVIGFETTAVASITEPTHTDPEGGAPDTEGYKWEYLYTVGTDVRSNLLTPTWLPVPDGSEVGIYVNSTPVTLGDLVLGDDSGQFHIGRIYQIVSTSGNTNGADIDTDNTTGNNTYEEWFGDHYLGTYWVSCQLAFPDYAGTGNQINNIAYRQVALLRNPLDGSGDRIADQWKGSAFEATISPGVMLALDNRVTITRAVGQTETVRLILEF